MIMNKLLIVMVCALGMGAFGGCTKAKSPDQVSANVAAEQEKASKEVADARADAAKDSANAAAKVDDKMKDLNNEQASGAYDVAVAKAEGDHKVATEKCEALSGDAQKNCKDKADADYAAAKANAKAREAGRKE
jgi:hypothetical protein